MNGDTLANSAFAIALLIAAAIAATLATVVGARRGNALIVLGGALVFVLALGSLFA